MFSKPNDENIEDLKRRVVERFQEILEKIKEAINKGLVVKRNYAEQAKYELRGVDERILHGKKFLKKGGELLRKFWVAYQNHVL